MPLTTPRQLEQQIARIMGFYHPRCIDAQSGFYHHFLDDGTRYNEGYRHLISSAQFVINYARFARHTGNDEYRHWARHGLKALEEGHRQSRTGAYAWTLDHGRPGDTRQRAEGIAFVMMAYAEAFMAGIPEADAGMQQTHECLERHFFEPAHGLYLAETDERWHPPGVRRQSANLLICRALLAAHATTQAESSAYRQRAAELATTVWHKLASMGDGWLWETFDADWRALYDRGLPFDEPGDGGWGFRIGHQLGWVETLVRLSGTDARSPWMLETAQRLFTETMNAAWDRKHDGLIATVDFNRHPLDRDKVHWVQAEALVAAARLAEVTGEARYWRWFDRLANYCARYFIDQRYGGWYRVLTADNRPYSREKSPGGKTDYESLTACYALLPILNQANAMNRVA
ncbi:AGE family epimerase/isomerase [Salinicola rhizosphaerae]|uniref:N-acylglucosamine 2-epimerase n=1 Tax=Salinicola rhizosphaerae TaxID=1443141 RepID=A0ABQ3DQV0_9GAMM|nr:AGE family epimerase/isomerase [Salinicola rhizosphaerae]GHB10098.1 N-acylglucosamine 2-epimerase [Salinicola rhizosphaerae]